MDQQGIWLPLESRCTRVRSFITQPWVLASSLIHSVWIYPDCDLHHQTDTKSSSLITLVHYLPLPLLRTSIFPVANLLAGSAAHGSRQHTLWSRIFCKQTQLQRHSQLRNFQNAPPVVKQVGKAAHKLQPLLTW
jgi:hypothetical protein